MNKLAIFDFDGTIADRFEISLQVATELLGRPRPSKDEIEMLRALSTKAVMRRLGIRPWQLPKLLVRGRKAMAARVSEIEMFTGLESVFEQLHTANIKICIMSSNDRLVIESFLDQHQCQDYFDAIVGGVSLFKKAGELKKIKKQYSIDHNDIVYVGDETRDIIAAKKVGVRSVAVSWGYNSESALKDLQPDILVKTPEQLAKELQVV